MSTEPVDAAATLSIGTGLPFKLVKCIQAGEFLDMAELLPDLFGIWTESTDKDDKKPTLKKHGVTGILEWVQCYCIYTAVALAKHPERNQDMLGYMALIVEACMEYEGDSGLGSDHRFGQMVAATPGTTWAKIDPTLWNMAFTGQARAHRCKFCFSLTHQAEDCDWAPTPPTQPTHQPPTATRSNPRPRSSPLCYSWNHSPDPSCVFAGCKYLHTCLYCSRDPQAPDKDHKAIHCPRRRLNQARVQTTHPQPGPLTYQRYHPY